MTDLVLDPLEYVKIVHAKGLADFDVKARRGFMFYRKLTLRFRLHLERLLSNIAPSDLRVEDFGFREMVYIMISFAIGQNAISLIDDEHILMDDENAWGLAAFGPAHTIDNIRCGEKHDIVSRAGYGYHREGVKPGSAPNEISYWIHGALVHLTPDLTNGLQLKRAIAESIEFGRASNGPASSFNIVLMSIQHFVLLKVSPFHLEQTKTMPLLRPTDTDQLNHQIDEPFYALMHFFDASLRATLKPEQMVGGVFPTEIYEAILGYVDYETHLNCLLVSRKFRIICQRSPMLCRNFILQSFEGPEEVKLYDIEQKTQIVSSMHREARYPAARFEVLCGKSEGEQGAWRHLSCVDSLELTDVKPGTRSVIPQNVLLPQSSAYSNDILINEAGGLPWRITEPYWLKKQVLLAAAKYLITGMSRTEEPTRPVEQTLNMWDKICQNYGCEEWKTSEKTSTVEIPAQTAILEWISDYHRSSSPIDEGLLGFYIGRPNTLYNVEETFHRLLDFRKSHRRDSRLCPRQHFKFVALAVQDSVELYSWDLSKSDLVPYGDHGRLDIFQPGHREVIEGFLKALVREHTAHSR